MMQKLRLKFIRIAMIALAVAMIVVTGAVNLMNWLNVRAEIRETMTFLAESDGIVSPEQAKAWAGRNKHRKNVLTQSVYFVGRTSEDGSLQVMSEGKNDTVDRSEAETLLWRAAAGNSESGFLDDYCYQRFSSRGNTSSWIFLNCESYLNAVRNLLLFSVIICAAGILLALLAVSLLSRKAIQPFLRNEQKQKRFITDASHELKAPLAVISANMDVLALKEQGNTWIDSTRNQVASMRRLVEDMVYLSRADETDAAPEMKILNLPELIAETAEPYRAMADYQGREFLCDVQEGLSVRGEESSLCRVVSILCDNAVKYTPEGGTIRLRAFREGRWAVIETENPPLQPLTREDYDRLFDRFYRADDARDREKQTGYGIGLSIAQAVTLRHGGLTEARMTGRGTLQIRLSFPASGA